MSDDCSPPEDEDRVGYGRPPKRTRFKPGHSGNPRGRPPKSKQLEDLIRRELDEKVAVKEGGRDRRITKREAIVKQLVNRAIKGDTKPLQLVLAHLEKHREVEPFVATEADDAELLKAMFATNDKEDDHGNS